MGEGTCNRSSREAADLNTTDDNMASVTAVQNTGNHGNHDKQSKQRERRGERRNRSLSRDSMRLSYRLAKSNLHPHFDSPTEENVEFGFDVDEFGDVEDESPSGGRCVRRRPSMTLALVEGELQLDAGVESGTQTPVELLFKSGARSPNGEYEPKTGTSLGNQDAFQTRKNTDALNSNTSAVSVDYPKHRGSFSPGSQTPKADNKDKDSRLKPREFMAKLRQSFSLRSSKNKEKKSTPVISAPILQRVPSDTRDDDEQPTVRLRSHDANTRSAGTRDPSNRLTWHGSTGYTDDSNGPQVRPTRSRKVGVSPIENARYSVDLQTSKSTMNVSEYGYRQIRHVRDFYQEDSDGNSSSAFASPTSSLCSSNPSSRPCSATDLNWERYNVIPSDIRRAESEGSVSRSEHGSRRQSRGSGSGHNTPHIGSPPTNGILYRSKSSPGTPCSLLRHISSLETIHQNTVGENVDVPVVVVTNGENNTATSRMRRRSSGEDSSSSSLGRKSQQKVTFEEEAERKRLLENASRTPKPRHQPRRVKTDLGDTRDISMALFNSKDTTDETPRPMRRHLRRRAISELGTSTHLKEAIEQRRLKESRESKQNGQTSAPEVRAETTGANKETTPSLQQHDDRLDQQQHPKPHKANHHKPSDSPTNISRSLSSQNVHKLTRSDSTETLKRTPSVPSIVSMDLEDVHKEDTHSVDMIHDETAPYLPVNLDLQAYGLGPTVILAEALWDHVTMDETELAFQAGDVIEVTDTTDKNWWWGYLGDNEGWIPTQFIRLRVSQGETVEECMERLHQEKKDVSNTTHGRISMSFLSNDQVRANVVHEIITTERDYVKHIRDVCDGYLDQAQHRPEMFSEESIKAIFSNISEIYSFHKQFSIMLETCIHPEYPHLSDIGRCFLKHKHGFDIYSDYCNNYPRAVGELKVLMEKPRYQHFFEACRLLRNMIEINLHGFLLTPIQKICKYPLQLGELLKYTRTEHSDYEALREALMVMKNVAVRINESKRTVENIDKIAAWQKSILDWEGEDILVRSTELIHSGEVTKVLTKGGRKRAVDRTLYLFDHQLIICKKDMLRRGYQYRRKLNIDRCRINDLPDGRENTWNINVKNGWKLWDTETYKMYIFCVKTLGEKVTWLQAFEDERQIVEEDRLKGVHIPLSTKEAAMRHSILIDPPSKPSDLKVSRKISSNPFDYKHKPIKEPQTKVSLPESISSADVFKERRRRSRFGFNKKQAAEDGDRDQ